MFLMVHFVVERWREALLWSWVVAKHGGLDDSWSEAATDAAWNDLGGETDRSHNLVVKSEFRASVNSGRVTANLRASGLKQSDQTNYIYSESHRFICLPHNHSAHNHLQPHRTDIPTLISSRR